MLKLLPLSLLLLTGCMGRAVKSVMPGTPASACADGTGDKFGCMIADIGLYTGWAGAVIIIISVAIGIFTSGTIASKLPMKTLCVGLGLIGAGATLYYLGMHLLLALCVGIAGALAFFGHKYQARIRAFIAKEDDGEASTI